MGVGPEPMEMENGGSTSTIYRSGKAPAGYFVSTTKALVLLGVAIVACIAVGLIVHFAAAPPIKVDGGGGAKTTAKPVATTTAASGGGKTTTAASGGASTKASTAKPIEATTQPKPTLPTDVRIPLDLEPTLYEIILQPYLEESDLKKRFTFDGEVTVSLTVLQETSTIYLHIDDVKIDETTIKVTDVGTSGLVPHVKPIYDKDRQWIKVPTTAPLAVGGNFTITMKFRGNLNDQLVGFYRSSYKRADGTDQFLATTQFQPTDARRAFPCMDEPGIKSKFAITIICDKKYTAIANTNEKGTPVINGNLKTTSFKTTPKMSTYLIAFVVSDFINKGKQTKNNVDVRVWARKDAIDTVDYALEAGVKILEEFGDFFQEKFPLEKQDMIAIPDFNAGAMENWGLVTYRETALLYDEKKSSISDKQRVCLVVAHELAHQWFGNLVTPKWWNDLWLNEGFASFVENIGIDIVEPQLKIMQQIVTTELQPTLVADSITSSHAISQEVSHPSQIAELFDSISYGKGSSVIRMMDFFLTRGYFQNGLQKYLEEFKYGNTESDDLWAKLTEAVKGTKREKDVKVVMDTWTLQMGFPVVTIEKNGATATASQKRFLLEGDFDPLESPFGYKWEIPLTMTTQDVPDWNSTSAEIRWMAKDGTNETFNGLNADSWIIGNIEQMGYYRVNYDENNWKNIIKQLDDQHEEINVKNRAQILDDAFNLARADLLHYETAFNLTKYLKGDKQYTSWSAAMNGLAFVRKILSQTSSYGSYMQYMKKIGLDNYKNLTAGGFVTTPDEDPLDETYLRSTMVSLMCGSGFEPCLTKAAEELTKWKQQAKADPNPIDLNLRSQIYCYGIEAGDAEIWQFIFEKYKSESVAAEKKRLMLSLACTKEPWILKKLLKMSIEKKDIRKQDGASVISAVARKEVGNPFAWDFIRSEWDYLSEAYGTSMSFARVILAVSSSFSNAWKLSELESFRDSHAGQLGSATRGFSQAVEKTKANIAWINKNLKEVDVWLEINK